MAMLVPKPASISIPQEFQQLVANWIKDKGCKCPCCQSPEWNEGEVGMLGFQAGAGMGPFQQSSTSVVMITCKNCGFLSLLSSVAIGIAGYQSDGQGHGFLMS
jgi:predicted nucleic-acid-binding Zn-ribbon protein